MFMSPYKLKLECFVGYSQQHNNYFLCFVTVSIFSLYVIIFTKCVITPPPHCRNSLSLRKYKSILCEVPLRPFLVIFCTIKVGNVKRQMFRLGHQTLFSTHVISVSNVSLRGLPVHVRSPGFHFVLTLEHWKSISELDLPRWQQSSNWPVRTGTARACS